MILTMLKRFFLPLIALAALVLSSCDRTIDVHTSLRAYCEAGYDKIGEDLIDLYSEQIAREQGGQVLIAGELCAKTTVKTATAAAQTASEKCRTEALSRQYTVFGDRTCHLEQIEPSNYDVLINVLIDGKSVVSHYYTVVLH